MTSEEIGHITRAGLPMQDIALLEIAYQLAVMNEANRRDVIPVVTAETPACPKCGCGGAWRNGSMCSACHASVIVR